MTTKIENIIVKYLTNQASMSELEELTEWLEIETNDQIFKTYVKTNHLIDYNMKQFDSSNTKKQLLEMINKEKKVLKIRSYKKVFKYAAAAILVIALASTYFLRDQIFNKTIEQTTSIIVNNQIEPGIDKATLTLETGETVALEKGTQFQTQNATSNGEEIIYKAGDRNNKEIAYNTLTIPRGGQYYIVLSDGTKIWLNSDSKLKYPVAFTEGETRQIDLIYGEAYFDVSPSIEHKGADFKVFHDRQEVQVLGTEFNIKAYKDETNIYTTLVEGKVAVNYNGKKQILAPTQQSNLNTKNNNLSIAIVDINRETSWKQGVFIFNKKPLKDIMKVLSRWYDMEVVFENKELETVTFSGTFNKNHPIEDILEAIKNTKFINGYEIHNKTITIK